MIEDVKKTVDFLKKNGFETPEVGIILGTGLGALTNHIDIIQEIPYENIPNFPIATVEFHKGKLIYGTLEGKTVVAMSGRFHYYEGYSMEEVVFPVRVLKFLGIQKLLISNAAGCMNLEWKKGELMLLDDHINLILSQNFINKNNIASKSIAVAVDGINSVGGVAIPKFLESLGIKKIKKINCNPDGNFNHNPEPLPENITDLCSEVKRGKYQLGIVVDPDADRLVLVDERGEPFGEEYTLVAAAEYLLSKNHGASTCSNLSSTLALKNITEKYGGKYFSSAVGEINVVQVMKEKKCLIGGEGNGGVIYPMTHYGRDSLIGIGLIISLLVERNISLSELKKELPEYNIFKTKLNYKGEISSIISDVKKLYDESLIDTTDGVKINFSNSWIHIRKSNTEPVIRIISEASSMLEAEKICKEIMSKLRIV